MTCDRCSGAGWRPVEDGYAERAVPDLTMAEIGHLDGPATEAVERDHARRRRLAAQMVYPCNLCNANLYDRWIDGHLDPDHRHEGCSVCEAVDESTGKRRRSRKAAVSVSAPSVAPEADTYQTTADF